MKWWGYLIFGLLTLILAPLSVLCSFFNPFSLLFLQLMAPVVRLLGYSASVDGWSSIGNHMVVNLIWPLALAPLYWLNFRVLHWRAWTYVGLFLMVNLISAFVVLLVNSPS